MTFRNKLNAEEAQAVYHTTLKECLVVGRSENWRDENEIQYPESRLIWYMRESSSFSPPLFHFHKYTKHTRECISMKKSYNPFNVYFNYTFTLGPHSTPTKLINPYKNLRSQHTHSPSTRHQSIDRRRPTTTPLTLRIDILSTNKCNSIYGFKALKSEDSPYNKEHLEIDRQVGLSIIFIIPSHIHNQIAACFTQI